MLWRRRRENAEHRSIGGRGNLLSAALQLAREIDDHAAGHKIATLWQERNHTYIHRLWKWDLK